MLTSAGSKNDSNEPLVTVVISTYNRKAVLAKAIQSVLAQSFGDFEILVCDDGSTDGTRDSVEQLGLSPKVRYLDCGRSGRPAPPRNSGLNQAKGEFTAFLDDDDVWEPGKLQAQLDIMNDSTLVGCSTNALRVGGTNDSKLFFVDLASHRVSRAELEKVNVLICSSVLVRTASARLVGGFPEQVKFKAVEDYGLWLKMASLGDFHYLESPLVRYQDASVDSIRQTQNDRNLKALQRSYRLWKWSRGLLGGIS